MTKSTEKKIRNPSRAQIATALRTINAADYARGHISRGQFHARAKEITKSPIKAYEYQ